MGKPTGFLEYPRELPLVRHPAERVHDWDEFHEHADEAMLQQARGPLHGLRRPLLPHRHPARRHGRPAVRSTTSFPEWNDLVYRGLWREALERLHKTNNFPEFTGRVCPAPVRRLVRARHQRAAGDDQEHRVRHRR